MWMEGVEKLQDIFEKVVVVNSSYVQGIVFQVFVERVYIRVVIFVGVEWGWGCQVYLLFRLIIEKIMMFFFINLVFILKLKYFFIMRFKIQIKMKSICVFFKRFFDCKIWDRFKV